MLQNALTVIVPIKSAEVKALQNYLTSIGKDIERNPHLSWQTSPSTHFARFVILNPRSPDGAGDKSTPRGITALQGYPPRLLFTSNYDGSFEDYMAELVTRLGTGMESIWSKCEGYPPGAATDIPQFTKFISDHSHLKCNAAPETFYVASRGTKVGEIRDSVAIRKALNKLLDLPETREFLRQLSPGGLPSTSISSSNTPPPGRFGDIGRSLGSFAGNLAEWVIGIRGGINPNLPVESTTTQLAIEDLVTQNQMTVIVPIRPRFKARTLLPIVLKVINGVAAKSTGSLSGLTTIHFARWAIIDEGRNLLFESNYDGSWENYIDDFVDRASLGMNIIWGNCSGFPRGGCKDIEWFKKYIRDNQIPAQVFYSAYRNSSIKNNLNDLQVARAVKAILSPAEIELLLNGAFRLTGDSWKKLMSDPTISLFFSGSYSRGVSRALNAPSQAVQANSHYSPVKNPARSLCLLAGLGVLGIWLLRRM